MFVKEIPGILPAIAVRRAILPAKIRPCIRMEKRKALAAQRMKDYASGIYMRAGGVIDPLPEDVSWFVKDYHAYYKCPRVIT